MTSPISKLLHTHEDMEAYDEACPACLEEIASGGEKEQDVKPCIKCAHLLGNRSYIDNYQHWKCGAPQNIKSEDINLVTGQKYKIYHEASCVDQRLYDSISDAHNNKLPRCHRKGDWFELYTPPNLVIQDGEAKFEAKDLDSLADKAAQRVASIKKRKLTPEDLNNL